jgi:hypothetical protein
MIGQLGMDCRPILDDLENNYRGLSETSAAALGDLSEISSELLLLDNEEVILVHLDQPQVPKSLHKHADPRPRRANHG